VRLRNTFLATHINEEYWNHQPFTVISEKVDDGVRTTTIRFRDGHEIQAFDGEIYLLEDNEEYNSDEPEAFYA